MDVNGMGVNGCKWMYLDVFDVLDVFGCIWMYLYVCGCIWMHRSPFHTIRVCVFLARGVCSTSSSFVWPWKSPPRNGVMLLREVPVCCTYVAQHIRRGVGTMDGLVDIKNSRSSFAISIEEDGVSIMLLFVKPCLQFCAG